MIREGIRKPPTPCEQLASRIDFTTEVLDLRGRRWRDQEGLAGEYDLVDRDSSCHYDGAPRLGHLASR